MHSYKTLSFVQWIEGIISQISSPLCNIEVVAGKALIGLFEAGKIYGPVKIRQFDIKNRDPTILLLV